jgi:chromate transport protein ChrA
VDYIQWVLQHLRMLSIYIVASIALMTELIWSYELHPASTLWLSIILIAIAAVGTLLSIVVQMNRNEVLSRINGTAPGTVTWDTPFVMNLTLIAVVPLVTFVGAELPWLREAVFSWLNPLLRSLGAH